MKCKVCGDEVEEVDDNGCCDECSMLSFNEEGDEDDEY